MDPSDIRSITNILQTPSVVAVMQSPEFLRCASRTVQGKPLQDTDVPAAMSGVIQNPGLTQRIALAYTKMHGFRS